MENIGLLKEMMVSLVLLTPISTGLTEVVKHSFGLEHARYLPAVSVVFGIISSLLLVGFSIPAAFIGVISGLSGTGLWEVSKTFLPEETV